FRPGLGGADFGDALRPARRARHPVVILRAVRMPYPLPHRAADLLHRAFRDHGRDMLLDEGVARLDVLVTVLDQQPRRLVTRAPAAAPPASADQHPAPFHPLSMEDDFEIAFRVALSDAVFTASLFRLIPSLIPQHHRAAAVLAL